MYTTLFSNSNFLANNVGFESDTQYFYWEGWKSRPLCPKEPIEVREGFVTPKEITQSWRNVEKISEFIGRPYYGSLSFNFGDTPSEKVIVNLDEFGNISRIRTYSGLNWSARGGYGSPICDTIEQQSMV